MSTTYQNFATVYDKFMDNIPYPEWSQYLISLLQEYHITDGNLVELGCGTGTLCNLLSQQGYHVTGIDLSKDMISIAGKKHKNNPNLQFLRQNMCELTLDPASYDGFYSLCDSINYLLYDDELLTTFMGVHQYLKKDGIFVFDLKTKHYYKDVLGNQVFCDQQKDCSYIWENAFFEEDNVNQYNLTLFIKKRYSSAYKKFEETHHQKAYELSKMIDLLTQAGLEYVAAYDAFSKNPPTDQSERIYIIAAKH